MSTFDNNDKIMMAHLSIDGVATIYSVIGDCFIYLCMAFIIFFFISVFRSGIRNKNIAVQAG
ncbi:MAG: hypothetical protein ABJB16_04870 [Saprospiraceae bacterium]